MERKRFRKALVLELLDMRVGRIAAEQRFDLCNGAAQLLPRGAPELEVARIARAVEYGRMRALEEFGCAIEEGLWVRGLTFEVTGPLRWAGIWARLL